MLKALLTRFIIGGVAAVGAAGLVLGVFYFAAKGAGYIAETFGAEYQLAVAATIAVFVAGGLSTLSPKDGTGPR